MKYITFFNKEIEPKSKKILDIGSVKSDGSIFHSNSIGDIESLKKSPIDVTASFMLHGIKSADRFIVLSEIKRISRKHIVLNDFMGPRSY